MLRIKILPDCDLEDPHDYDSEWKLYAFSRNHHHSADPTDVGFELGEHGHYPNIGLRRKLAVGTAFMVSYFEHGLCKWGLGGSMEGMPDFRWDGVANAGVLVWGHPTGDMGAKSYQDRAEDAARFLDTYTAWCNGDGYGYVIVDPAIDEDSGLDNEIDSCFGFYGNDTSGMAWCIAAAVAGREWEIDDSETGMPWNLENEIAKAIGSIQAQMAIEAFA